MWTENKLVEAYETYFTVIFYFSNVFLIFFFIFLVCKIVKELVNEKSLRSYYKANPVVFEFLQAQATIMKIWRNTWDENLEAINSK